MLVSGSAEGRSSWCRRRGFGARRAALRFRRGVFRRGLVVGLGLLRSAGCLRSRRFRHRRRLPCRGRRVARGGGQQACRRRDRGGACPRSPRSLRSPARASCGRRTSPGAAAAPYPRSISFTDCSFRVLGQAAPSRGPSDLPHLTGRGAGGHRASRPSSGRGRRGGPGGQRGQRSLSQPAARGPSTIAAVAAALASTHVAAATLTVRQYSGAGAPVAGSTMWWTSTRPAFHRRTVVLEVARPPARIATICPPLSRLWSSPTWMGQPSGRRAADGDVASEADEDVTAGGGLDGLRYPVGRERLGRRPEVEFSERAGQRDAPATRGRAGPTPSRSPA